MSIPDRFYRIAKFKLREIKDRWDELDARATEAGAPDRPPADFRTESRRELDQALDDPVSARASNRSPEPVAQGTPAMPRSAPVSTAPATLSSQPANSEADALAYHYRLLGVDIGSDFPTVQFAYNRLAARSDPARFPVGSEDARTATQIRERLDKSYTILRDALDPTARRFDLLEY